MHHYNFRGRLIEAREPLVMAILNLTPDSFYEGSRTWQPSPTELIDKAGQMLADGAAVLDLGGYSTRPGAKDVSEHEELDRLLPAIETVTKQLPEAIISIDTFRAKVAQTCVEAGAAMINDVSGGNLDDKMFKTVARLNVPFVLMHMRGTPKTMTSLNQYDDLTGDIIDDLQQKVHTLRQLGQKDIIIDPGFGFAKNIKQNYELLARLHELQILGLSVMAGLSRKSMIWKKLNITSAEALNGTTALHMVALQQGANWLRVHDVKEAAQTIKLHQELAAFGDVRFYQDEQ